jgi:hypothetical protein
MLASIAMALVAWFVERALSGIMTGAGLASQGGRLAAAIGAGLVTLAAASRLLRLPEFDETFELVRNVTRTATAPGR